MDGCVESLICENRRLAKELVVAPYECIMHNTHTNASIHTHTHTQSEELALNGLVESLTRKNRHLAKELVDAQRSAEDLFAQLLKAQSEKVG